MKQGPGIAKAICRAAGGAGQEGVLRLAEATMGVRLQAVPPANLDVVEAGLAYATGLWWLAASGLDLARADVRDLAQEVGDELVEASRRRTAR